MTTPPDNLQNHEPSDGVLPHVPSISVAESTSETTTLARPPFRQRLKQWRHWNRRQWLLILLVIAVLAGILYGAWYLGRQKPEQPKQKNAPIIIAPVSHRDMPVYLNALGTVQAFNTVTVHSRVDGQLMALKFTEGQMMKAGDLLAEIDDRQYKAQRDQAAASMAKDEATFANAERDLARYRSMGDSIARQVMETQEATVKSARATVAADKAALDNAETQLSYCTIVSPIDGRTGIRAVDVGNIIHAGDTNGLVTITQLEPIYVIFSLPQQNLAALNEQMSHGDKLAVDALASDNQTIIETGQLELIDNEIDQTTGTIKLKATFANKKHALWPGGFVNIRLLLATHKYVITVPTVAVQRGPQGSYVFRYNPTEQVVNVVPVTVGVIEGENSEVLDGLNDGDKVVTDGMAKLQDKTKVKLSKSKHHSGDAGAPKAVGDTPPADTEKPVDDKADSDKKDDVTSGDETKKTETDATKSDAPIAGESDKTGTDAKEKPPLESSDKPADKHKHGSARKHGE